MIHEKIFVRKQAFAYSCCPVLMFLAGLWGLKTHLLSFIKENLKRTCNFHIHTFFSAWTAKSCSRKLEPFFHYHSSLMFDYLKNDSLLLIALDLFY